MKSELAELEGHVHMQKSISSLSHGARWQYKIDGRWEAFSPEANERMLEAYLEYLQDQHGCRYATISSGGVDRQVDFKLLQQKRKKTKTVHRIHLLTGAPVQWVTPAADLLQQGNHARPCYVKVTNGRIRETVRTILASRQLKYPLTATAFCGACSTSLTGSFSHRA